MEPAIRCRVLFRIAQAETLPGLRLAVARYTPSGIAPQLKNQTDLAPRKRLRGPSLLSTMSGMGFHDLIKQYREADRESLADSVWDELTAEYDSYASSADAKITSLAEEIAVRDSEVQRLKVVNYDLLQSGAPVGPKTPGEDDNNSGDDDPSTITIDDLFGEKE